MLVAPEWFWEDWWPHWKNKVVKAYYFDQPLYLSTDGHLRDMPKWCTIVSVVDGHRHNHDNYHHTTDTDRARVTGTRQKWREGTTEEVTVDERREVRGVLGKARRKPEPNGEWERTRDWLVTQWKNRCGG